MAALTIKPRAQTYTRLGLILYLLAWVLAGTQTALAEQPSAAQAIRFQNYTREAGLLRYSQTFSAVISDLDGDGIDDLFVGNHGRPPLMFLNRNLRFVEQTSAHPITQADDRHAYTFVDLDNDGDKDFLFAGGGADGLGDGTANEIYKNLLAETGVLTFTNVSAGSDISYPTSRARIFFPIANQTGSKVDLYLTALHRMRPGSTNLYILNNSDRSKLRFDVDPESTLNVPFPSDGKDVFFDFDRDGQVDLLQIGYVKARLYKNISGKFRHFPSALDALTGVLTAVPVDFNNDGFLDLYLGFTSGRSSSDFISHSSSEIHIALSNAGDDYIDQLSFKTESRSVRINFVEHVPRLGASKKNPDDIFLGENAVNPATRRDKISRAQARGKPGNMDQAGTYIWFDTPNKRWHVVWKYHKQKATTAKGIIFAAGITDVRSSSLETFSAHNVTDYIFINQWGKGWKPLKLDLLEHNQRTNYLSAADFNNDGFIDVVGVRTQEDGNYNGSPFILINHGDLNFGWQEILTNEEDDIYRADLIVHGFFNDDGLPDIFVTNGFGLLPAFNGPYLLGLNTSTAGAHSTADGGKVSKRNNLGENGYILLELEGTTSNRDAIGAQVELWDMDDLLLGYRELGPGYGRGQNTHKLHFGLGKKKGPFLLKLLWPGAKVPQEILLKGNGYYHLQQE